MCILSLHNGPFTHIKLENEYYDIFSKRFNGELTYFGDLKMNVLYPPREL